MTKVMINSGLSLLAALLLTALPSSAEDEAQAGENIRPLVFVITGESNSGGIGVNADASAEELEPRPNVQIMNLTIGDFGFEPMQLGVNNLRDHYRLENYYDDHHGLELGLANAVDGNAFPSRKPVYLIKTGHGGSRIAQWAEHNESGFWQKFVQRTNAAKRQLPGNSAPQWVIWFSLGINDAIDGTPIEAWKEGVRAHIARMKKQLPGAVIVMTRFQAMGYPDTNQAIADIAHEDASVVAVDSTGTTLRDKNHWDYAGLKAMATRMVAASQDLLAAAAEELVKDSESPLGKQPKLQDR